MQFLVFLGSKLYDETSWELLMKAHILRALQEISVDAFKGTHERSNRNQKVQECFTKCCWDMQSPVLNQWFMRTQRSDRKQQNLSHVTVDSFTVQSSVSCLFWVTFRVCVVICSYIGVSSVAPHSLFSPDEIPSNAHCSVRFEIVGGQDTWICSVFSD